MTLLTFIGFWIVVSFGGAVVIGKWLKRQRIRQGGDQPWDEEWTT